MKETTFGSLQSIIGKEYHCSGHALGDHREGLGDVYFTIQSFKVVVKKKQTDFDILLKLNRETERADRLPAAKRIYVPFGRFKRDFVESPTELQFAPDMSIDEISIEEPECK